MKGMALFKVKQVVLLSSTLFATPYVGNVMLHFNYIASNKLILNKLNTKEM